MKQSELTQLYVLLNKFREEYVNVDDLQLQSHFDAVDDTIDKELSSEV